MSISSEIIRLANAREDMKSAISGKGVTVPSDTQYDDISSLIDSISSSGFPNGTEWTQSNITSSSHGGTPVYGNGVWTTGRYYSTDNGKTWTQNTGNYRSNVTFGNGVFVGTYDGTFYHSTDGINWTESSYSANGVNSIYGLKYHKGVFIAWDSDNQILYSSNGTSWRVATSTGYPITEIICRNTGFVAWTYMSIHYSTNGSSWSTATNLPMTFAGLGNVIYGGGVCIVDVADDYSGIQNNKVGVYVSSNFTRWTQLSYDCNMTFGIGIENLANVSWEGGGGVTYGDTSNWYGGIADYLYFAKGIWHSSEYQSGYSRLYAFSRSGLLGTVNLPSSDSGQVWSGCGVWLTESLHSSDGITWVEHSGLNGGVFGMVYANGTWIASTSQGLFYSVAWE